VATQGEPGGAGPGRRLGRTRQVAAWVLVVLTSLLVPLSVITVWAMDTVTNTDRYVATMAPLARQQVIVQALAVRSTDELFASLGVQQHVARALPKPAGFLAAPLTSQLRAFVEEQVDAVLSSTWFQSFWDTFNRTSHAAAVSLLTGRTTPGRRAHRVVADLSPLLGRSIDALQARGITVFDGVKAKLSKANTLTLSLASDSQIARARSFFRLASDLGWVAPLLTVAVIAAAVAVAVDRRRALLRATVGAGLATVVLLATLALGRTFFVDHAAAHVSPPVSAAIFDTLTRFLSTGLRNALLATVVVAAVLWLAGPSPWARRLRTQVGHRSARAIAGWMGSAPAAPPAPAPPTAPTGAGSGRPGRGGE